MTWKDFFEKAQRENRDISYSDRHFKILSVGADMVHLGGDEYQEYLSYHAIVSVGDYKENGKTLVVYSAASAVDVEEVKNAVDQSALDQA